MDEPCVAVDGLAGTGKSTFARLFATRLGWRYLDTGSMYRAVTLACLERGVDPTDPTATLEVLGATRLDVGTDPAAPRVALDGSDVTLAVRGAEVTAAVSAVARHPALRRRLVDRQRELAAAGEVVVEGRDIGTVVLPRARLKVWLTASPHVRASRRAGDEGETPTLQVHLLARRDACDSQRADSPARPADDAVVLDSTSRSAAELVEDALRLLRARTPA